jgi:hypothetical protein
LLRCFIIRIVAANVDLHSSEAAGLLCCGGQDKEHEDEEECTYTQRGPPLLESFDDNMLLQELVRRRGKIQVVEAMGETSPAATAPLKQSSGACGSVSVCGGEADHEATCGDDAELDSDMDGSDVVELILKQKYRRFRGVSWSKEAIKWQVQMTVHGTKKHLGCFDDKEAAARAYDKAVIELGLLDKLNFDDYELPETASASPAPQRGSSRFRGVSWSKVAMKWRAREMKVQGVEKSLGCFDDEEAAAQAYEKAAIHRARPVGQAQL